MAKEPRSLTEKVVIATGAAGGVGKELVRGLVREGCKVAAADLSQEALEAVAAEIGGEVLPAALDVSDLEAYEAYINMVEEKLGPVDYLINVAAIMPVGPFEDESDATTAREIAINLAAVIHSTKVCGRKMKARGTGHIINVASGAAWMAGGGGATYCGTKFGVLGYSESVALELKGTGVEISIVAPGVIKTELSTGLKEVRGVRAMEPWEVAEGIIDTMKHPRFVTFVPKAIGVMSMALSAVPHRPRHAMNRFFKTDKLLLNADMQARLDYEKKASGQALGSADKEPASS